MRIIHPWNSQDSLVHASGHPPRPDVEKLLHMVKPKMVIPVHCEAEHRHSHINFVRQLGYKAYNLRNNTLIEVKDSEIRRIDHYANNKMMLDGNRLITDNNKVFGKRKEMNDNGFVMISVKLLQKKSFTIVTNYGLYEEDNAKTYEFNQEIKRQVDKMVGDVVVENKNDRNYALKNQIIFSIRKFVKDKIQKTPLVGVHFI